MARDYKTLPVFKTANDLTVDLYKATESMTYEAGEQESLRADIRGHARRCAHAIVGACLPHRQRVDFADHMEMALSEATCLSYLVSLAFQLGHLSDVMVDRSEKLVRELSEVVNGG